MKFFGKHSISFSGANNCNCELFLLPSCQTRQRCEAELQKKESTVDCILNLIAKNTGCSLEEAAECIVHILLYSSKMCLQTAMKKDIALDGI